MLHATRTTSFAYLSTCGYYIGNLSTANIVWKEYNPSTENRPVAKSIFSKTLGKDMQDRFTTAIERLIYLSGGRVEQEKFQFSRTALSLIT